MALRVALVVPHIFMQNDILPNVIFSPGQLAIDLTNYLTKIGVDVTLFTAGEVTTAGKQVNADLSFFKEELELRGDTYLSLLKKHPLTFITLARQVQASLVADAYKRANDGEFDIVHIYTNEEDIALPFAKFCKVPVVFTHHDPFNFLVGYRHSFPKYKDANWLSISQAQRIGMPKTTNWVGTIHHGLDESLWPRQPIEKENYVAFIGRIIEPKGLHIAIEALRSYNRTTEKPLKLKIAGKHYGNDTKNDYWTKNIEPLLDDPSIEFVGFINDIDRKQEFLAKAKALVVPSLFDEPFGMVIIESLACSTPVIGIESGAIPEIIEEDVTGFVARKKTSTAQNGKLIVEQETIENLSTCFGKIDQLDPTACRHAFEQNFTLAKMAAEHKSAYEKLLQI